MGNTIQLEQKVAAFLRDELAQRYSLDNTRHYEGFNGISDDDIQALRAFGLRYIYPEWEDRCFQRKAFQKLMALLNSPMRLKPLVAVTLKSMWRLGRRLPKAIDTGKQVINAFAATQALEEQIVAFIADAHEDAETIDDGHIVRAVATISPQDFAGFIDDMEVLMRLLAQRSLLEAGAELLADIAKVMETRTDHYDDVERAGMRYALEVMTEGMALFENLDENAAEEAIETIPEIEQDWYETLLAAAESN